MNSRGLSLCGENGEPFADYQTLSGLNGRQLGCIVPPLAMMPPQRRSHGTLRGFGQLRGGRGLRGAPLGAMPADYVARTIPRLVTLGYTSVAGKTDIDNEVSAVIADFQDWYGLTPSGELDENTYMAINNVAYVRTQKGEDAMFAYVESMNPSAAASVDYVPANNMSADPYVQPSEQQVAEWDAAFGVVDTPSGVKITSSNTGPNLIENIFTGLVNKLTGLAPVPVTQASPTTAAKLVPATALVPTQQAAPVKASSISPMMIGLGVVGLGVAYYLYTH